MIKYNFICKLQHSFDMWFKSLAFYEKQASKGNEIICPICGTDEVRKQFSAPALVSSKGNAKQKKPHNNSITAAAATDVDKMSLLLKELKNYVTNNFEYVGNNFKDTALKMHKQEEPKHNIYGEATKEDLAELYEEGVGFINLPTIDPKKLN